MLCPYIRSSSYGAYEYCALKYFFNYVLGWSEPPNSKAQMGTVVHKVMEVLAVCKKTLQDEENPKKTKFSFTDEHIGEISFTKKSLFTKDFVSNVLDKSFDHYSQKDTTNNYGEKEYNTCAEWVDMGLEYNDGQFDPRNRIITAPEMEFDLPIMEDWALDQNGNRLAIKGTIDLVTQVGEDTLEVVDYKTGKRINWATGEEKTFEKLHDDAQLLLYYYAISKLFPQYKYVIMTIFFIRDGGPFSLCFDESDYSKFLSKLEKRYKEILNDSSPKPINKERSDFRCHRLCHFYKNRWPGSNQTMCHYVEDQIKVYGLDQAIIKCKKPDFDASSYKAPGA